MTLLAIGVGMTILSWIGLAVGLAILLVVLALFTRVLRQALEIKAYADRTLDAAQGIERNLDELQELERTQALIATIPEAAGPYVEQVRRRLA